MVIQLYTFKVDEVAERINEFDKKMEADQAGKLRNDSKLEGLRKGRKEADEILDGKVSIYILFQS